MSYGSPAGTVYYEFYQEMSSMQRMLAADDELLQCVVAKPDLISGSIPFGTSQWPMLWDYADKTDSMKFLLNLYKN